jgi:antitoxin component HigA of HigAB toxin-antitoxin module
MAIAVLPMVGRNSSSIDGLAAKCNAPRELEGARLLPIPIRNIEDYREAQRIVDELSIKDEESLTEEEQDILDVLTVIMLDYEAAHFAIQIPKLTPVEFLKNLMESSGMSESDLGRLLGERTLGYRIIHGERQLSKKHIKILSEHFKIDPAVFL